jgi:hypothetical protein
MNEHLDDPAEISNRLCGAVSSFKEKPSKTFHRLISQCHIFTLSRKKSLGNTLLSVSDFGEFRSEYHDEYEAKCEKGLDH